MTKKLVKILQTEQKHLKKLNSITAWSLVIKLLPSVAYFTSWIYLSKMWEMDSYGTYQNFWIQLISFSALASIGFPIFILTYSEEKTFTILRNIRRNQYFLYAISLSIIGGLFSFLQSFSNNNHQYITNISILIMYCLSAHLESLLIVWKRWIWGLMINAFFALAFVLLHYLSVSDSSSNHYTLYQNINILLVLKVVLSGGVAKYWYHKSRDHRTSSTEISEWKQIQKTWRHLCINDWLQVAFKYVDKFTLSLILSSSALAVYINATIDIPFLPILLFATSSAALQMWAQQSTDKTSKSFHTTLKHNAAVMSSVVFPLFFFLVIFSKSFLYTVFNPEYTQGLWIFVTAQLVLPVRAFSFTSILQTEQRADLITKGAVFDFIIACVLMYPFYLAFKLPGIAFAFVVSTYWQAWYYLNKSSHIIQQPILSFFPLKLLASRFIISGLLTIICYAICIPLNLNHEQLFWIGLLFCCIFILLGLYKTISKSRAI